MGVIEIFTRPEQHPVMRVLGWLVRYRAELFATTVVVVVAVHLRRQVGPDWTTGILVAAATMVFVVPVSRRYTTRRMWCVYSRHRARACFVQTRTMTYDGRMPFLYWSRPSPVGERIRVWLPAGLEVKDLEQITAELAVACWARTARVEPNRRFAHLVVIEIVRRDPLGDSQVITPVVMDDIADDLAIEEAATGTDAAVVPLPARSTLPPPVRDEPTPVRPMRPKLTVPRPREASSNGTASNGEGPVTGFGGVDVSDYV